MTNSLLSPFQEKVQVEMPSVQIIIMFSFCWLSSGGDWWEFGKIRQDVWACYEAVCAEEGSFMHALPSIKAVPCVSFEKSSFICCRKEFMLNCWVFFPPQCLNLSMKPLGPENFFLGKFLTTNSISLVNRGQLKNLSISLNVLVSFVSVTGNFFYLFSFARGLSILRHFPKTC